MPMSRKLIDLIFTKDIAAFNLFLLCLYLNDILFAHLDPAKVNPNGILYSYEAGKLSQKCTTERILCLSLGRSESDEDDLARRMFSITRLSSCLPIAILWKHRGPDRFPHKESRLTKRKKQKKEDWNDVRCPFLAISSKSRLINVQYRGQV